MSHQITYLDGRWQVYRVVNGKYRLNVGPRWMTAKEARDYCDLMDTSPLRDPVEVPTTPIPVGASTGSLRGGLPVGDSGQ
jgi:hypothetical protein